VLICFRNNQEGRTNKKRSSVIIENPRKNRTKKEKAKVWFSFVLYKEKAFFNKSGLYSANFKKSNINHWCWFLIFATIPGQWILQKDHLEVLKTIWWTKFIRHVTKQTIIIATKQLKESISKAFHQRQLVD
jgi:hypothetical protein